MDNSWISLPKRFIHKLFTAGTLAIQIVLDRKKLDKILILKVIIKLSTGLMMLNNYNKRTISNIY